MKRPDASSKRSERRTTDRVKVRKVGRIVGDKVWSCIILDLSESGALLLAHDKVPDEFKLYYAAKKLMWSAEVVRRQRDTIAIRFTGASERVTSETARSFEQSA